MKTTYALVITLATIGVGCTSTPSTLDSHFGETVNHVLTEQTYNPAASHSNSPRTVMVFDGEKAAGTLDSYRKTVPEAGSRVESVGDLSVGK